MTLQGRVALVTGAGQGVGEGIAHSLHREGASVVIAEFDAESGQRCAEALPGSRFVQTDVRQREQVEHAVADTLAAHGRLDILVNNAYPSGTPPARLENRTDSDFNRALEGGFMAPWWAMQAAFPAMRDNGWGRIINLASLNGVNAHPYTAEYNAAKEALRALSRTAAREWARYGICVNILCPAARTPAYDLFVKHSPENASLVLQQNPMGRMGDPVDDIGGVAVFLASDAAQYLTGNTLFADGGSHLNGVNWEPPVA
ncbi:SDR family NAD(P)-dependent oxidoreductase [Pseudohalioglobus sediminis]|nr:SDR family oxidoreductase [Pseudohalioglobus sediminis]